MFTSSLTDKLFNALILSAAVILPALMMVATIKTL